MKTFELFETMIHKLIADNYITMEQYFLDITKIEADTNKFSFVWKKSTLRFEEKLREKVQETLAHIHTLGLFSKTRPKEPLRMTRSPLSMLDVKSK